MNWQCTIHLTQTVISVQGVAGKVGESPFCNSSHSYDFTIETTETPGHKTFPVVLSVEYLSNLSQPAIFQGRK